MVEQKIIIEKTLLKSLSSKDKQYTLLFLYLLGLSDGYGRCSVTFRSLANALDTNDKRIRTLLNSLEEDTLIIVNSTSYGTTVKIRNYNRYKYLKEKSQLKPIKTTKSVEKEEEVKPQILKPVVSQPTLFEETKVEEKPKTETKPQQIVKTKEEIAAETEKRKEKFYNSLIPYLQRYPKEMIRDFFDYWSEPNKSKSKMRWEMQPTWDLGRRLGTWDRNQSKYERNGNKSNNRTAEERTASAANLVANLLAESQRANC